MGINDLQLSLYSSHITTFISIRLTGIFSISDYSLDAPISGEALNSIIPTFYFSVPMDIASYELRIRQIICQNLTHNIKKTPNKFTKTDSQEEFQKAVGGKALYAYGVLPQLDSSRCARKLHLQLNLVESGTPESLSCRFEDEVDSVQI